MNINDIRYCHGYFISDTVNPKDVLRIHQGTLLRLPPGKLIKWCVLRSVKSVIPLYGIPLEDTPESIIAPTGATWESFVKVDVDFAARIALPGMFSLGGDIASLPGWAKDRLKYSIAFYKKWKGLMLNSVAHLLTPVYPKEDGSGWAAIQLQSPEDTASLLFVYRLDDACHTKSFYPQELDKSRRYMVKYESSQDIQQLIVTGEQLMSEGIAVKLPNRNNAEVVIISPV
jgi:hypothetical protein